MTAPNRAERRRAVKQTAQPAPRQQTINLQSPQENNFEQFIIANSMAWQVRAMVELEDTLPPAEFAELDAEFAKCRPGTAFSESPLFHDFVEPFAKKHYIVQEGSAAGQHLVLCGAGPTLRDHAAEWCPQGDQVWGCNSAAIWLSSEGHKITHGFTVDQTPHMVAEWHAKPDIDYLLASTVHPHLTDHLVDRRYRFFHNYVGIRKPPVQWLNKDGVMETMAYEDWLYALLYPATIRSGAGLNAVTRAIEVAQFMGFDRITVLGADCSIKVRGKPRHDLPFGSPKHLKWLREHTTMHADGGHALASEATAVTLGATIDGRYWLTKPDMAITAQWLVKMAHASNGQVQLIGDTLPVALYDKSEAFWARMPNFMTSDGQIANVPLFEKMATRNEREKAHATD